MTDSPTGALSEREAKAIAEVREGLDGMYPREEIDLDAVLAVVVHLEARAALASRSTEPGGEALDDVCVIEPGDAIGLLSAAEVLFAPLCKDATTWVWIDKVRSLLASTPPPISASKEAAPAGEPMRMDALAIYAAACDVRDWANALGTVLENKHALIASVERLRAMVVEESIRVAQPTRAALIEECCARIKAADDKTSEHGYMLDSNDCISVLRGTWKTWS